MKILGISGGTKNGNNDAMCKEALMACKEMGAEVEFIRLLDINLKHCTGCIACVKSLMSGNGGVCSLKDDFKWLENKMYDADGIVFAVPIFEKGAAGVFHTLTDRFGPGHDTVMNMICGEIAKNTGGKGPDQRVFKAKPVSFIGIGGSDWAERAAADFRMLALTIMWNVIDNEIFKWSKGIMMEDDKVAKCHQIGINLVNAAKNPDKAEYKGDKGICPHCHTREFYLNDEASEAICAVCGIKGEIKVEDGKIKFVFPEEQLEHAHDTIPGKFKHCDDIKENEGKLVESKQTVEYKQRVEKYKAFIQPSVPNEGK